mgnify:CR=1 FL=1
MQSEKMNGCQLVSNDLPGVAIYEILLVYVLITASPAAQAADSALCRAIPGNTAIARNHPQAAPAAATANRRNARIGRTPAHVAIRLAWASGTATLSIQYSPTAQIPGPFGDCELLVELQGEGLPLSFKYW